MGLEMLALAALVVGIEDETSWIGLFQQDHPHGRHAVRPDGCERHGIGVVRFLRLGLAVPGVEQLEGFGKRVMGHDRDRGLTAHVNLPI